MGNTPFVELSKGGYRSRKFVLVLVAMIFIAAGGIIGIYSGTFAGLYPTFIGGILAAAGLYFGSNVTESHLGAKVNASLHIAELKKASVKPKVNKPEPEVSAGDLNQDGE